MRTQPTEWEKIFANHTFDKELVTRILKKLLQKNIKINNSIKKLANGTSLVVQWLRICLPVQGTWVWALVWEDPTCCRATKPVCHKYWDCALEPASHNYWACVLQLLKPARLDPCSATREATAMRSPRTTTKSSPNSPQLEEARAQQWRPNAAKKKNSKWSEWIFPQRRSTNV